MPKFPFDKIAFLEDFAKGHVIQWQISPEFKGKAPYRFTLQASEDPAFQTLIFSIDVGESFYAVDDTKIKQNWQSGHRYRIKLTTDDDETVYSEPINFCMDQISRHKYLLASEIVRKEYVRMQFTGRFGWLLKRKLYSAAALDEIHPITGIPISDNKSGFGTGIEGGYYPPVIFKYNQESRQETNGLAPDGTGVKYEEDIIIRTVGFPGLDVQDFFVTDDGKRFIIKAVKEHVFPGTATIMLQTCTCRLVSSTDTIYQIPVDTQIS